METREIKTEAKAYNKSAYSGHYAGEDPSYHFTAGAEWARHRLQSQNKDLKQQLEKEREKIKEAYTDGFSDSRFDFDIENYTQNQSK